MLVMEKSFFISISSWFPVLSLEGGPFLDEAALALGADTDDGKAR